MLCRLSTAQRHSEINSTKKSSTMSTLHKSSSKKHRSEKGKSHKHKGKDKAKAQAAHSGPSAPPQNDSPFLSITSKIRMSVPPAFASDLRRGAEEMLDSLIMR
jgi:DNA-directed RNA polymerase I subunit RPA43